MGKDEADVLVEQNSGLLLPRCWFLPICILMTAMMDFLFYGQIAGWTVAFYFVLLGVACLPANLGLLKTKPLIITSIFLLAALGGVFINPDCLSFILALLALILFRMIVKAGWQVDWNWWLPRLVHFVLYSLVQWGIDSRRAGTNGRSVQRRIVRVFMFWIIPLILSMVFIVLFSAANPLIEQAVNSFMNKLTDIKFPAPERVIFWLLTACLVWALLRMALGRERSADKTGSFSLRNVLYREFSPLLSHVMNRCYNSIAPVVTRCLILFNLIFLVQNVLDIEYLWGGVGLPAGMTYAAYAHRGAYPLIATALLAGGFVLIC